VLNGKRIVLIITGGIAAFKCLDLIRRLRERGALVRCVLTPAGARFVTPLSLSALSEDKVYSDLFSLTDEHEMGHIELSRDADLLVVAPATANMLAKMANGIADDLASTVLLATDKDVVVAPAMNVRMWEHSATQANVATLGARGILFAGPADGPMACGEFGAGRMIEPLEIIAAIEAALGIGSRLVGRRALVTSGPTVEEIDPVRYIANRSSGKQGHAIASAFARMGADTVLVTGPTGEPDPLGASVIRIESARDMLEACNSALPVDIAVCAAAVSDWRPAKAQRQKLKKFGAGPPELALIQNPDILATLAQTGNRRPRLVIGFAAETHNVVENAIAKRESKGCDWILANDVSSATGTFGGDNNTIHLIDELGVEDWPHMSKADVADHLAERVAKFFESAE